MKNILLSAFLFFSHWTYCQQPILKNSLTIQAGTTVFLGPIPYKKELHRQFNSSLGISGLFSSGTRTGLHVSLAYLREFAFATSINSDFYYYVNSKLITGFRRTDEYDKRSGLITQLGFFIRLGAIREQQEAEPFKVLGNPLIIIGANVEAMKVTSIYSYSYAYQNHPDTLEIFPGNETKVYTGIYTDLVVPFNITNLLHIDVHLPLNIALRPGDYPRIQREYFISFTPSIALGYKF